MGVRQMAQDYVADHGPASNPMPGASDKVRDKFTSLTEEEVDTKGWMTERAGQSRVDQGIGIMVAVIVIGSVAIPVATDVIDSVNASGVTGQVLGYVPLALGVGLFVAAISIVR